MTPVHPTWPRERNTYMKIFTIGHSTRSWEQFAGLLREFEVLAVIDVRRHPSSRTFPHFNRPAMEQNLVDEGIEYHWLERLGGRRHGKPAASSPNTGIRSPGFRNYADHMLTEDFRRGVEALLEVAVRKRSAILCAEKLYWKCHRSLLSDYLFAQGIEVVHIEDSSMLRPHKLTAGTVIDADGILTYPLGNSEQRGTSGNHSSDPQLRLDID